MGRSTLTIRHTLGGQTKAVSSQIQAQYLLLIHLPNRLIAPTLSLGFGASNHAPLSSISVM